MNDRLELENRSKPTPFNGWNKINRVKKYFSDDTTIRRQGKEVKLQDFINENNKDCTIYQVLNTYRGDKKLTSQALNTMSHKVIDELQEIKDLPTAFEAMKKAEESWRNLPLEVRKEFNNNKNEFQKNGIEWANKKIKEWKESKEYKLEQQAKELNGVKENG